MLTFIKYVSGTVGATLHLIHVIILLARFPSHFKVEKIGVRRLIRCPLSPGCSQADGLSIT